VPIEIRELVIRGVLDPDVGDDGRGRAAVGPEERAAIVEDAVRSAIEAVRQERER
jgi:hypothetical protein